MLIYLCVNSAFGSVASLDFGVFGGCLSYCAQLCQVLYLFYLKTGNIIPPYHPYKSLYFNILHEYSASTTCAATRHSGIVNGKCFRCLVYLNMRLAAAGLFFDFYQLIFCTVSTTKLIIPSIPSDGLSILMPLIFSLPKPFGATVILNLSPSTIL